MYSELNPYLQGPFRPLLNEYTIEDVKVEGALPAELRGTLYRQSSNPRMAPINPAGYHWFDGDGMLHAFRVEGGRVSYRCRYVQTEALKTEAAAGRSLYNTMYGASGFNQGPLPVRAPQVKSTASVHAIPFQGQVLATDEIESFYTLLDGNTLATLGKRDFGQRFEGSLTAHPHLDPLTGNLHFFANNTERCELECCEVDAVTGQIVKRLRIRMSSRPWMHDFIFTERFYIFVAGTVQFRPLGEDRIKAGRSLWYIDETATSALILVDRKTGAQTTFAMKPGYSGHFLNAYEHGNQVIVDFGYIRFLRTPKEIELGDYIPFQRVDGPPLIAPVQFLRAIVDLTTQEFRVKDIIDFPAEMFRMNEAYVGRQHRYAYMVGLPQTTDGFNQLMKHDFKTGVTLLQPVEKDRRIIPMEPVFVPRPDGEDEDDGWVLSVCWDPARQASELVVLDSLNFAGVPIARVKLDHGIALGPHGSWLPMA